MQISQLEYFVAMAEEDSFSAAAKKLHISPQALIKSIGKLEDELGVKLYIRDSLGAHPTTLARRMVKDAERILEQIERLKLNARSGYRDEVFHSLNVAIATSYERARFFPSRYLAYSSSDFGDLTLNVSEMSNDSCLVSLARGRADVAIVVGEVDDACSYSFLYDLQCWAALPISFESDSPFVDVNRLKGLSIAQPVNAGSSTDFYEGLLDEPSSGSAFVWMEIDRDIGQCVDFVESGGAILFSDHSDLFQMEDCVKLRKLSARGRPLRLPVGVALRQGKEDQVALELRNWLVARRGDILKALRRQDDDCETALNQKMKGFN